MKETAIEKMVRLLGGQTSAAIALGVSQPTVFGWLNGKHGIAAHHALHAEVLTGIPASDLCPKIGKVPTAAA